METNDFYLQQIKPITTLDLFMLSFLKTYFKNHPEFPYTEDSDTKISIISSFDSNVSTDMTPRLVLQSSSFSMMNPGLLNQESGNKLLKDLTQNSSIINKVGVVYWLKVITRTIGQARSLAEELLVLYSSYTERIKRLYDIKLEKVWDVESETPEIDGNVIIGASNRIKIIASYIYTSNVKVLPIYPILKSVEFERELELELEKNNRLELNKLKFNK